MTPQAIQTDADWAVLEDPRVEEVLNQATTKVARKYDGVLTVDDLHQEGAIWLALNAGTVYDYLADEESGERNLFRRLHDRLMNQGKSHARHTNRSVPLHLVIDRQADATDE